MLQTPPCVVNSVTTLNRSKLPRTFAAFQHPAYRIMWSANFSSLLARWMQMTLLGWMVLTLTDSAWRVSLVGFFSLAPMLFVGLLSGVLADRFDRLKLLRVTQVVGFAAAIGMAAVLVLGKEEFWHAYVTITLVGSAWALELPTRRSMIHDLVGTSGVTNAVALDSIGMNASAMVGPALAGVLISQVDVVGGYVAVVGFSMVSMVLVWMLRLDIGRRASAARRRMTVDLLVGLRYTLRHPTLLAVVLITIVMNVLFFPYRFLIPVIARDVLGVGPDLMGLMDSIAGLGASAGAIAIASSTNVRRHGLIFIGGSVVAAVCLMGFSFSKVYLLSLVLLLVLGAGTAGFSTMQATVVMLVSRAGMRGKALGVISLAIGTSPAGSLILGALAERVGAPMAIAIISGVSLSLLFVIGLLMPTIRAQTELKGAEG